MTGRDNAGGFGRRQLLRGAAVAGAALAANGTWATAAARANPGRRQVGPGRTVAVFGGGVSGLTAAHELAERGYAVTVYEPTALGGKARSMSVPGTGAGGRADLPGEHGFRFFPGCYQHVPDTMARIPFPGNANGVAGNLIRVESTVAGFPDLPPVTVPTEIAGLRELNPERIRNSLVAGFGFVPQLPPQELAFFGDRMMMWFTSSPERRFGEWEYRSWVDAVAANGKSQAYRDYLARALTRITVAAKSETSSARTIGTIGEALVFAGAGIAPQYRGGVDRILNGPTNEAWIDPWVAHLSGQGVRFVTGAGLTSLRLSGDRISGANVGGRAVQADWYVCAMPADRAAAILDDDILAADPALAGMRELVLDWMVGVQFYLRRPTGVPEGHIAALGSPWAITALRQAPMWRGDFAARYGDGTVVECLSADVSDWDTPGILFGKPAKQCSKDEVVQEVWAQLKRWLNTGTGWLRDDDLHSWFVDSGVHFEEGGNRNDTPLLVNTVGSWDHRPEAHSAIGNVFFCGDHVRTGIDLATMEGACEAGRKAANAVLDAAGDAAPRAAVFPMYAPPELEPFKRIDADRYRAGLPHLLDM
ncbi:FAD-dependent oxidoreductase [Nocardia sp. 852002-20019_SCH5090214]|uniref:hydroxysqualene dehydroxylase n=1 Tax=Nocardia sp. 852002-20019_SCH5090214 TaxID=1834087 RepID=UPI0007EB16F0|nr:FAD-dependent oxidoreductase [Nocardia sp. 852002-20019_SCH5090214]OBA63565.1 FAD-dependent oxidoreductase [Nocardia sp. 852002-20019_SCH5090214]